MLISYVPAFDRWNTGTELPMGLVMGIALGFRYFRQTFSISTSEHRVKAGAYMADAWEAFLERNHERIMYRYPWTVQELMREVESLESDIVRIQRERDLLKQHLEPRSWWTRKKGRTTPSSVPTPAVWSYHGQ